jgi:predicted O-methyltransferase YrrM
MILEANLLWQYKDSESGLIMPWYTLPALEWLIKQDVSKWHIFEYGSGYSTIWFRAHCKTILSVDHSEKWAKAMNACAVSDKKTFIESINLSSGKIFDCIIVDSEYWREECAAFCIPYLKQGGFLIIDNWESENYDPKVNEELFRNWPIEIFKQPNHSTWKTAILTKP